MLLLVKATALRALQGIHVPILLKFQSHVLPAVTAFLDPRSASLALLDTDVQTQPHHQPSVQMALTPLRIP
jgi:hypothetical protein